MILAIDTATLYAGLALYSPNGVYAEEAWYAGRNHTIELMPRIVRMLNTANVKVSQLTALAVTLGPGSFTGLRIGLSVAKGMALPHKLPVVGVPTLEIVAYPLQGNTLPVWAIAGAGRGRIWTACYGTRKKQWQIRVEPCLTTFEELAQQINEPSLCIGEIDDESSHTLQRVSKNKAQAVSPSTRLRRAGHLAEIGAARLEAGDQDDPDALVPIYISTP